MSDAASDMMLARLNALDETAARDELSRCCGATRWAETVLAARPFRDEAALFAASDVAFGVLGRDDWLQAFAHHPRVGELESLREKFASTRVWASGEQSGTSAADEATLRELAEANRLYLERFGFIFIICATGKSAGEMLSALRERLPNDAETELHNAAQQQKQITRLRLRKLLDA